MASAQLLDFFGGSLVRGLGLLEPGSVPRNWFRGTVLTLGFFFFFPPGGRKNWPRTLQNHYQASVLDHLALQERALPVSAAMFLANIDNVEHVSAHVHEGPDRVRSQTRDVLHWARYQTSRTQLGTSLLQLAESVEKSVTCAMVSKSTSDVVQSLLVTQTAYAW